MALAYVYDGRHKAPSLRGSICGGRSALMRINVWIILGIPLGHHSIHATPEDTQRICANEPTASVCER
jgi:hypothetical protein